MAIQEAETKTVTIVVDGTPHQVPKKETITYAEVIPTIRSTRKSPIRSLTHGVMATSRKASFLRAEASR
jgi:hypothetical protein